MKNATFDISRKILGPVHLLTQMDKWNYLWSPIIEKYFVLTLGMFLEAMGTGIGTVSFFWHSFSFSNNVGSFAVWILVYNFDKSLQIFVSSSFVHIFSLLYSFFRIFVSSIQNRNLVRSLLEFDFWDEKCRKVWRW